MDHVSDYDVVVVGAGLFGLTVAERVSNGFGRRALLLDRRESIGGNAASYVDSDTGIEVHRYGSHIFHTSNQHVVDYVRRFTDLNSYRHTVRTNHRGQLYSMPINLGTICAFFGRAMTPDEARALVKEQAAELGGKEPANLEEKAISLIGRPLYEAFIRGYTHKQWQTDPTKLDPSIITRLPVRFTFNDDYFNDPWQGIPAGGYQAWFEAMLAGNPLVDVVLSTDFDDIRAELNPDQLVVYTGPIDAYFDHACGRLEWRTLDLKVETVATDDFQGTAVVNYADESVPFTRIHEFAHYHPERPRAEGSTVIMREYSRWAEAGDEPYYPVRTAEDLRRLEGYRALAAAEPNVFFGGRLGSYRYLDMHMAIASALVMVNNELGPRLQSAGSTTALGRNVGLA